MGDWIEERRTRGWWKLRSLGGRLRRGRRVGLTLQDRLDGSLQAGCGCGIVRPCGQASGLRKLRVEKIIVGSISQRLERIGRRRQPASLCSPFASVVWL